MSELFSRNQIYKDVPPTQRAHLQDFRAAHPHRQVTVGNIDWSYIRAGQGSQTLLFLPGAFMRADMWFQAITALADKYEIVALDSPAASFDIEVVTAAILAILHTENVTTATVIGMSYGGGLGQYLLQYHPDKVDRLVLSHCNPITDKAARAMKIGSIVAKAFPAGLFTRLTKKRSQGRKYPASSKWDTFTRAYLQERGQEIDKQVFIRFLQAGAAASRDFVFQPGVVRAWAGDVAVFTSRDDDVTFKHLAAVKARYPQATSHIFAEGGHHTTFLFPEEWLAALTTFLHGGRPPLRARRSRDAPLVTYSPW